jgi:hypothetical protein
MSPAVNESNVKHYRHTKSVTDYKKFPGRSHCTVGQDGWEEVADYVLGWATEVRRGPSGCLIVASALFTNLPGGSHRPVLGGVCQNSPLCSALVYSGWHILGARERKDNIVGTIAEPRKDQYGWRF